MTSSAPARVLRGDVREHPAVRAWSALCRAPVIPDRVQVLRELPAAGVYRLAGAGPAGLPVIAKRCSPASNERIAYERILPLLPVTTPACYGSHAGDGQTCWLFLEDLGDTRYTMSDPTHLALTARWLALLHTSAASLGVSHGLPEGGPSRYLAHLRAAREQIQARLTRPALLTRSEVALQQSILSQQDALEARWSWIEQSCHGLPATLVHGDFRPKNVHLRARGTDLACYPIDWEMVGWGIPAADLTRVDVSAYWCAVRDCWDGLDLERVERLAKIGQVFRRLAAIDWESQSLVFDSRPVLDKVMSCLVVLRKQLAAAVRGAGVPR